MHKPENKANTAFITEIGTAAETGRPISWPTALAILRCSQHEWPAVMAAATAVRRRHFGDRVIMCSILNARSGACTEDCKFCAQSAHHHTGIETYSLLSAGEMISAYEAAARLPITHFGVVTSGDSLDDTGLAEVCSAATRLRKEGVEWCASLGSLSLPQLQRLKAAGLKRFHHNLETAESFFPEICTTHTYADRLATLHNARAAGLELCSGGILGLGETDEQRVEFAFTLQKEKVDSIPLNFLVPIKGTRLENMAPMRPLDILRAVAMFRMVNPTAEIKVCAGRIHLRDLQSMIFFAGATGIMVGNLLTVAGRDANLDLQMLKDLELDNQLQQAVREN